MTREEITITGNAVSDQLTMSRVDFIRLREADRALAVAAEREAILEHCEAICKAQAGYGPPPSWMQLMDFIRARGSK